MRRVSVVIPSYNHAPYIASAIRSVLDQDYPNIELIIIDDGSRDGSPALIREVLNDTRGREVVFEVQANAGAHATITRGLSMASGDVLTILNSDDHYETSRISTLLAEVGQKDLFVAFSKTRFIDDDGEPLLADSGIQTWYDKALREAAQCPTVGFGLLRNNISVTSGNLVFSRELYERVGQFENYRMCHDWDFLMRCTHWVEPTFVQKTLMAYRVHATNTLHSTRHLLEVEGIQALNTYLALEAERSPPNPLAPSAAHWALFFDYFLASYNPWFADRPIAAFRRQFRKSAPKPAVTAWSDAPRLAVPALGYIPHAPAEGVNLPAYAFLRELALRDMSVSAGRHAQFWAETLFGSESAGAAAPEIAEAGRPFRWLNRIWSGSR